MNERLNEVRRTKPSEAEVESWAKEKIQVFLSQPDLISRVLNGLLERYLAGHDVHDELMRLLSIDWFFAGLNFLRQPKPVLERALSEFGFEEAESARLKSFWSLVYPVLEDAIDAAIDGYLRGIHNTWTGVRAKPEYLMDRHLLLLDIQITRGLETVFSSRDEVVDFLALARSILAACRHALQNAVSEGLSLDPEQVSRMRRRIDRLERLVPDLRDLASRFPTEETAEEGSGEPVS